MTAHDILSSPSAFTRIEGNLVTFHPSVIKAAYGALGLHLPDERAVAVRMGALACADEPAVLLSRALDYPEWLVHERDHPLPLPRERRARFLTILQMDAYGRGL